MLSNPQIGILFSSFLPFPRKGLLSNGRFPNRTIEGGVRAILLSLIDFLPEQAKCSVLSSSAVLFNKTCGCKLSLH